MERAVVLGHGANKEEASPALAALVNQYAGLLAAQVGMSACCMLCTRTRPCKLYGCRPQERGSKCPTIMPQYLVRACDGCVLAPAPGCASQEVFEQLTMVSCCAGPHGGCAAVPEPGAG